MSKPALSKPLEVQAVDGEVVAMAKDGPPAFSMEAGAAHVTAARIENAATEADQAQSSEGLAAEIDALL